MQEGYFRSVPDEREPYTVVIPPPNVTGVLHMGHMLNNTIQDVLVRRARMQGKNACWVPGPTMRASPRKRRWCGCWRNKGSRRARSAGRIPEACLRVEGEVRRRDPGAVEEARCQLRLGPHALHHGADLSEAVIDVFIDLHKKGLVYRGLRMVNWDPVALTAVSDEEVIHKEVNSKLFHVRYKWLTPLSGWGRKRDE
jgi:valyl-tRNA synthetase